MIIFGSRSTNIGSFDVDGVTCDYCENQAKQRVVAFGKYAHVFWIPMFPIGKKVFAECTHCKKTIAKKDFSSQMASKYEQNEHLVKRPIWHWVGLGLFVLLFGSSLVSVLVSLVSSS